MSCTVLGPGSSSRSVRARRSPVGSSSIVRPVTLRGGPRIRTGTRRPGRARASLPPIRGSFFV